MKNKNFIALEYDKILQLLAIQTSCDDAREIALNINPLNKVEEVQKLLNETYDAHMLTGRFGSPSFSGIKKIVNLVKRADAGAVLTLKELLNIAEVLRIVRAIKGWREHSQDIITSIDWRFDNLISNKYLESKIFNAIISEDEISDSASSELMNIRKKKKMVSSKVREQLDKMTHSQTYQKYLQDPIVTIRNERFVIPVKAEFRSEVPGLVHDMSSSGATVFVEPMGVVEANNEIRILKSKEEAEIERILSELSVEVGAFSESIISSYNAAVELNVVFAKAALAYKMKAVLPKINNSGKISLKGARHPLIRHDEVVATDIELGKNFDALVITGPNTGGKTVSLKTIGILTLMTMSGLMIPASEGSEVSVFKNVLVDIGDEQSIEQSLSTFSSHMVNIIEILSKADSESLVLLDELGSGTDPVEGAALAMAILEKLRTKGAKIAATTHYAELKAYAIQTQGVENACCEFDVTTLKPTYKLLIGVPGRSNAFAISEKLGMDQDIIDKAKGFISGNNTRFEDVVKNLEKSRQSLERERREVNDLKILVSEEKKQIDIQKKIMNDSSEAELSKAREQAQMMLSKVRVQTEALINELDEIRKDKNKNAEANKMRLKAKLNSLEEQADPVFRPKNEEYVLPRELKAGDNVLIFDIDKKAVVLEAPGTSDNVLLQAGIIKTRVPLKNVRLLNQGSAKKLERSITKNIKDSAEASLNTTVDLRGKSAMEAIIDLDAFLDSAMLMGVHQVTVIHGKGTGVLRTEVQKHLRRHPCVKTFRLGVFGEGESGVTIVEIK